MSAVDLSTCSLHAVVGRCHHLRQEMTEQLVAAWDGPVQRSRDPDDFEQRLLSLATPSLFASSELQVVTLDRKLLARHQDRLAELAEGGASGGCMLLVTESFLPKRASRGEPADRLSVLLEQRGAVHRCEEPDRRRMVDWVVARLLAHPQGVEQPREVAEGMLQHRGDDPDLLIQTIETVAACAGDEAMAPRHVEALFEELAEAPIYEFTNSFVSGESRRALVLLYAGRGLLAEQAIAALANELRKMLGCLESEDDKEVYRIAGLQGSPTKGMYYTRKRAAGLGRRCLQRLLKGVLQANWQLRQTGTDAQQVMETLVLQAQRVIRQVPR